LYHTPWLKVWAGQWLSVVASHLVWSHHPGCVCDTSGVSGTEGICWGCVRHSWRVSGVCVSWAHCTVGHDWQCVQWCCVMPGCELCCCGTLCSHLVGLPAHRGARTTGRMQPAQCPLFKAARCGVCKGKLCVAASCVGARSNGLLVMHVQHSSSLFESALSSILRGGSSSTKRRQHHVSSIIEQKC
jgi:hypothetical protein